MSVKNMRHGNVAENSKYGPPIEAAGFMAQNQPGPINAGYVPGLECQIAHSAHLAC